MASTETKLRRGTKTQVDAMTPALGEAVVDTTNNRLCLGNATQAGGFPHVNYNDERLQTFLIGTVGGTADAITLANLPVVGSYANGLRLRFKATATNTTATTVNVDSLGVKNIYKLSGTSLVALTGGEIVSGAWYELNYDGTQFQLGSGGASSSLVVRRQVLTSSGTYTPNANMLHCDAEVVGAGGGTANSVASSRGGGGAGGYAKKLFSKATIGASQTVTIGAGVAASTGGTTSLGALLSATGGTSGGFSGNSSTSAGGTGGTGSSGDINITGNDGSAGHHTGSTQTIIVSGEGGVSAIGGASYGKGANGINNNTAGANGVIIITEYCSA